MMKKRIALGLLPALLLLLCACTGSVPPAPSPAPTAAPTAAPPPGPAPTAAPEPTPSPEPTPEPPPVSPPAEADRSLAANGKEYPACLFSGALADGWETEFSCVLPLEAVTADYEHNAWVFRSVSEPETLLELSFIAGGDVESLLPGFMDGYLDFTSIEFSEAASLGRVRGDVGRVTAENGERLADAWLLDVSGGTAAAVLLCPLPASEEEALLRAMLETFTLR